MTTPSVNSLKEYLEVPAENREAVLENGISHQFEKDIEVQLNSGKKELIKTAMILASRFKLIGSVPSLFKLIDSPNNINPLGNIDPISVIIDFGPDAFNILMDCISEDTPRNKIRITSEIVFHWLLNEPDKMNVLLDQRKNNMNSNQLAVIESSWVQLKKYKNA